MRRACTPARLLPLHSVETSNARRRHMPFCYRLRQNDWERSRPMELRSMQYFVQVADEGCITRTADKIGIAQPALTRHIKQLEAELGTQPLTRLSRRAGRRP